MPVIKLLKRMAGPDGNYSPGFIMEVDADVGQQLVDQGAAEWLPPKRQQPVERAVKLPVEKAVATPAPEDNHEEQPKEPEVKAKPKKKSSKK